MKYGQKQTKPDRYCPDCGRAIPFNANFCPYCRKQFLGMNKMDNTPYLGTKLLKEDKKNPNWNKIGWSFIIVFILAMVISSIFVYFNYDGLLTDDEGNFPKTWIEEGTIYWGFKNLDGTTFTWSMDIDTYNHYISQPEPSESLNLEESDTGEIFTVTDLREYVQSDFFKNVIYTLTDGNDDKEFVGEVVNFKNQLITYGSGLGDNYQWPAETLTEGRGKCGDTSILMASLLKAGEERKNYGIQVYFWYCDADNMNTPQDVNHVIVEIEYSDGYSDLIETTSDKYYSHDQVVGWKLEV